MPHFKDAERILAASSDRGNPGPAELFSILDALERLAVVGISRDPRKAARRVPSYMAAKGYDVIPVNPYADRILGREVKRTLADVSQPVEVVLIFRPSELAGPFLRQAATRPERPTVWLQEGIRADPEAEEARERGIQVVQDLCIYKVHRALADALRHA